MSVLSKISHFLLVAIFAVSISAEYKLGRDYKLIDNPLPVKKDGVVEVTESFWYGCYGCYSFEPAVNAWAAKQGSDVDVTKILAIDTGSNMLGTEFARITSGSELASYEVDYDGIGFTRLRCTPASATSTVFTVIATYTES